MHGQQTTGTYDEVKAERDRTIQMLNQTLGYGHYYFTAQIFQRGAQWVLLMTME